MNNMRVALWHMHGSMASLTQQPELQHKTNIILWLEFNTFNIVHTRVRATVVARALNEIELAILKRSLVASYL